MLDSWNDGGFFQTCGLHGVQYGQIMTAMYLKVSVSDFLTLFSARTGGQFVWQGVRPSITLMAGATVALTVSSIVAIFWPVSDPDSIPVEGLRKDMGLFIFVWLYSLIVWFVQDAVKVAFLGWMRSCNFCNLQHTRELVLPPSAQRLRDGFDAALEETGSSNQIV